MNYIVCIYVVAIWSDYPINAINHIWIIYEGDHTPRFGLFWWICSPQGVVLDWHDGLGRPIMSDWVGA